MISVLTSKKRATTAIVLAKIAILAATPALADANRWTTDLSSGFITSIPKVPVLIEMASVHPDPLLTTRALLATRSPESVAIGLAATPTPASRGLTQGAATIRIRRNRIENDLIAEARALAARPPRSLKGASTLACMAVALYHEARNQSTEGQHAVASVIMRRAEVDRWDNTICDVIREHNQFSFMTGQNSFPAILEIDLTKGSDPWRVALAVSIRALVDGPLSKVAKADHYHTNYVSPAWGKKMQVVARIGSHIFYRDPQTVASR